MCDWALACVPCFCVFRIGCFPFHISYGHLLASTSTLPQTLALLLLYYLHISQYVCNKYACRSLSKKKVGSGVSQSHLSCEHLWASIFTFPQTLALLLLYHLHTSQPVCRTFFCPPPFFYHDPSLSCYCIIYSMISQHVCNKHVCRSLSRKIRIRCFSFPFSPFMRG